MNRKFFILSLVLVSCSQAGAIKQNEANQIGAAPSASVITLDGYVGVGALSAASVNLIDLTDDQNPVVLDSTTTDADGYFSLSFDSSQVTLIELVANDGSYVDPFTYNTVSGNGEELKAIYKISSLDQNSEVYLTPISSLFVSIYDCLDGLDTLSADPYFYAASIFNDVFDLDLFRAKDLTLNPQDGSDDNDALYTLYNLAFSKMSSLNRAASALDVLQVFSEQAASGCSLIVAGNPVSKSYAFSAESFRKDYLNALDALQDEARFGNIAGQVNLTDLVSSIRASQNLIFGFKAYEN